MNDWTLLSSAFLTFVQHLVLMPAQVVSQCPSGQFYDLTRGDCADCSTCHQNSYTSKPCGRTHDVHCVQCVNESTPNMVILKDKPLCQQCPPCPAGYKVVKPCSSTRLTKCKRCPKGTFNERRSYADFCLPCESCGWRKTVRKCSMFHNTVCGGCKRGFYLDHGFKTCMGCRTCTTGQAPEPGCARAGGGKLCGIPRSVNVVRMEFVEVVLDHTTVESISNETEDGMDLGFKLTQAELFVNTSGHVSNKQENNDAPLVVILLSILFGVLALFAVGTFLLKKRKHAKLTYRNMLSPNRDSTYSKSSDKPSARDYSSLDSLYLTGTRVSCEVLGAPKSALDLTTLDRNSILSKFTAGDIGQSFSNIDGSMLSFEPKILSDFPFFLSTSKVDGQTFRDSCITLDSILHGKINGDILESGVLCFSQKSSDSQTELPQTRPDSCSNPPPPIPPRPCRPELYPFDLHSKKDNNVSFPRGDPCDIHQEMEDEERGDSSGGAPPQEPPPSPPVPHVLTDPAPPPIPPRPRLPMNGRGQEVSQSHRFGLHNNPKTKPNLQNSQSRAKEGSVEEHAESESNITHCSLSRDRCSLKPTSLDSGLGSDTIWRPPSPSYVNDSLC